MIGYITLGSDDPRKTRDFYDRLFGAIGGTEAYALDSQVAWSFGADQPMILLTRPYDGAPASTGNGTMVALNVSGPAEVDRVHALALSIGAKDEGAPGPRGKHFYGGYFRSPDGHKFNLFMQM